MKKTMIKMVMLVSCTALFATFLLLNAENTGDKKTTIKQIQAYAEDPGDEEGDKFSQRQEYDYTYETMIPIDQENNICLFIINHSWGTNCI